MIKKYIYKKYTTSYKIKTDLSKYLYLMLAFFLIIFFAFIFGYKRGD